MTRNDVLELRHVRFARADYDQLMTRAINCIVSEEGVQNYVGSVPDYKNEKSMSSYAGPWPIRPYRNWMNE